MHASWNLGSADDLLSQFSMYESEGINSSIRLAIVTKTDGSLIGTAGFHTISDINRSAELAYGLAPDCWGRGIMQAAAMALSDWGFHETAYKRMQATVLDSNSHSIQLLERMGFEREGYLRAFRMVRGTTGNFWMYSRLHPDIADR